MLWFMLICAVGAILLFAHEALADLFDAWKHPEHLHFEKDSRHPKSRVK